ncbi:MAG: alpha/beta hydrolase [Candidatus Omnitrophica bacterium]|nr:alpha/beta hydrolase [Candidatus Omnitrophota bacterium]
MKSYPVIALEVLFLTVFWLWAFSAALFLRNTWLPRMPITISPDVFGLPAETVRFSATDGLPLEGWKIAADPSQPWILGCHGVGSNRADLLEIASGLHQAGFNLFLFDFRGHGGSAGRTTSFGLTEQRDLEGALAFLGQQPEIPATPYGIYGISMGGAVALMVAGKDERLGAVAVDSSYTDLDASLAIHQALLYPWLPRQPFLWFIRLTYKLRFGIWPAALSPQHSAARLGRRPLLIIGGAADPRMPAEGLRQIQQASGASELWLIDGAAHLEGYSRNPKAYLKRLGAFFSAALAE